MRQRVLVGPSQLQLPLLDTLRGMSLAANDPRPKSVQAADALRGEIGPDRTYKPGDRLPPTRELAKKYGIAVQTLRNSLGVLVNEGLVFSSGNVGYFVSNDVERASKRGNVHEEIKEIHSEIRALADRVAALEERSRSGGA